MFHMRKTWGEIMKETYPVYEALPFPPPDEEEEEVFYEEMPPEPPKWLEDCPLPEYPGEEIADVS